MTDLPTLLREFIIDHPAGSNRMGVSPDITPAALINAASEIERLNVTAMDLQILCDEQALEIGRLRTERDEAQLEAQKWFKVSEQSSGVQKEELEKWHRSQVQLLNSTFMDLAKSLEIENKRLLDVLREAAYQRCEGPAEACGTRPDFDCQGCTLIREMEPKK
jgi:hypothetical protein